MVRFLMRGLIPILLTCWIMLALVASPVYAQDNVLIIRGDNKAFSDIVEGISADFESEITIDEYVSHNSISREEVETLLATYSPNALILIGNQAINAYSELQNAEPLADFPPAIALGALHIDKFVVNMSNTKGIRYEIPAVTSLVHLRTALDQPVKNVGVLYRSWMKEDFLENVRYCQDEGINLIGMELPNSSGNLTGRIKSALSYLKAQSVDAIWVVNDNVLLTKDTLVNAWLPELKQYDKPVVVGIESLLYTPLNFGSYAIVPDHYGLGVQSAGVLGDLMDNDWQLEDTTIEPPLSIRKLINTSVMKKKRIPYRAIMLDTKDKIVK